MDEEREDWLEKRLRDELAYIDDDGFTSRVLQALPAQRARPRTRAAILLAVAVAASFSAYLVSGRGAFVYEAAARVSLLPVTYIYGIVFAAGVLVMAASITYAMSKLRSPDSPL